MNNKDEKKREEEKQEDKIKELAAYFKQAVLDDNQKVLVIIGAGCSAEAGIKTSQQVIDELDFGFQKEEILGILRQQNLEIPFDDIPMEAYLSAYKEIFGPAWEDIDSKLREFFPDRENVNVAPPPLCYCLLAHLMKYDFVHSIISLNFDELLEQALDDSLGIDGYKIVSSRSAFGRIRDLELYDETKVLYKPHGTISHPMTLRATWEKVNRLDDEKIEVLKNILEKHSIWIFVGYKFNDLDITPLFSYVAQRHKKLRIWFVNTDRSKRLLHSDNLTIKNRKIKQLLSNNFREDNALKENNKDNLIKHFIRIKSNKFFREFIKHLFSDLEFSYYRKGYGYRILDILYEHGLSLNLEKRIIYRIFLYSLITKGKFADNSLIQFTEIRNLLRLKAKSYRRNNCNKDLIRVLNESLEKFRSIFKPFILKQKQGINTIYYLKYRKNLFKKLTSHLIMQLPNGKREIEENVEKKLFKLLKGLWEETDIILPSASHSIPFVFSSHNSSIICDLKGLFDHTDKIMERLMNVNGPIKELNIVAETGSWLTDYFDNRNIKELSNLQIKLIITNPSCDIADSYHKDNQQKIIKKLKEITKESIQIKYLPFYENSRHMTLSIPNKEGIFFIREAKSPFITPIYIKESDFEQMNQFFNMLWEKRATTDVCETTDVCTTSGCT